MYGAERVAAPRGRRSGGIDLYKKREQSGGIDLYKKREQGASIFTRRSAQAQEADVTFEGRKEGRVTRLFIGTYRRLMIPSPTECRVRMLLLPRVESSAPSSDRSI
jgi:hypothetical protein